MKVSRANIRNFLPCAHCGADCVDPFIQLDRSMGIRAWRVDLLCDCGATMEGEEMRVLKEAFEFVLQRWQRRMDLPAVVAQIGDELAAEIEAKEASEP